MAARTHGIRSMLLHPLAQRQNAPPALAVLERRDVRRRRRRRSGQDVVEDPFAPSNHRRPVGERGGGQEAPLAEETASILVLQRDPAEVAAVDVRDAVMFREPFVQERVVGCHEVEHAAVLVQDALEEELRLAAEIEAEVLAEIGEQIFVGGRAFDRPQLKPLTGEVGRQRFGPRVGQHPLDLLFEHSRLSERALRRRVQELVVGDAAPEEERHARRQIDIADPVCRVRRTTRGLALHAEEKFGTDEEPAKRQLNPAVESRSRAPLLVKAEQDADLRVGGRAAVGAPGQGRQNLTRAGALGGWRRRAAYEDAIARGGALHALRLERTRDRHARDGRLRARRPFGMGRVERLAHGLDERSRPSNERRPDDVRSGLDRHAHLVALPL